MSRYDSATDQWFCDVACSPIIRHSLGLATLGEHLYAVGGEYCEESMNVVERYDVRQNEWTAVAPLISCRGEVSVSVLDGCLYAVGGTGLEPLNTVERFDPRVGRWEEVCPMSIRRSNHGSAVLHGELYVVGGGNDYSYGLKSVEKYVSRTNKWAPVTDMNVPRENVRPAAVDGKLYAIGRNEDRTVEVFDPKTNYWKYHSDINRHRCLVILLPQLGPAKAVTPTRTAMQGVQRMSAAQDLFRKSSEHSKA